MKKIFVIEDNTEMLELMKMMLKEIECELYTFNNAQEAFNNLNNNKPDLILCDLLMPDYNGFKFLEDIKKNDKYKDIKIIVLSVVADNKIIDKVMNLGADYFLPKPFRVMELINIIKNLSGTNGHGKIS